MLLFDALTSSPGSSCDSRISEFQVQLCGYFYKHDNVPVWPSCSLRRDIINSVCVLFRLRLVFIPFFATISPSKDNRLRKTRCDKGRCDCGWLMCCCGLLVVEISWKLLSLQQKTQHHSVLGLRSFQQMQGAKETITLNFAQQLPASEILKLKKESAIRYLATNYMYSPPSMVN